MNSPVVGPRRVLFVDARVPTPNRDGGSLRLCRVMQLLRQLSCEVTFVPSFPGSFPPFTDSLGDDVARLRAMGVDVPGAVVAPTVEQHLEQAGDGYDLIWVSGIYVASRHLATIRARAPRATLLFDTIDLHFLREYREARLTGNVPRLRNALTLKRVELRAARVADYTIVVSDRERALLERECPRVRTWVVPSVHDVRDRVPAFQGRRDLLYLGAFTFAPNVDAVVSFVRRVLPAVRERLGDVTLYIIGSDPTDEVLALRSDSVVVVGSVENLAPDFDARRVFVAPLRYGAGIKGKLLLSMGQGLPAVASPIAVEGIPVTIGHDVLVAERPEEWPEKIAEVYQDPGLWTALSVNGRALVRHHYSAGPVQRRLEGLLAVIEADVHRTQPVS